MLNLLPPEIKEERTVKSRLYGLILGYITTAVVVGLGLAGLATWGFIQQSQIGQLESDIQQLASQRHSKEELINKASFVEDRLKTATTLQEKRKWEEVLNEIASATPTDTKLNSIHIANAQGGKAVDLAISGASSDRRSIVLFRDKLEEASKITKTTILSLSEGLTNGQKVFNFSLSAVYSDGSVKETP
jgi:Tfp pilus assembly protein PilN